MEFEVKFDQKVEVWSRQIFYVNANSEKQALELAKTKMENDGPDSFEYIPDTEVILSPKENDNQTTAEWFVDDKLIENNDPWVCTDSDTNQYRLQHNDFIFEFREDRIVNPETGEKETYQSIINIRDVQYKEIDSIVSSYGYVLLDNYLLDGYSKQESLELIAECIFEQEV